MSVKQNIQRSCRISCDDSFLVKHEVGSSVSSRQYKHESNRIAQMELDELLSEWNGPVVPDIPDSYYVYQVPSSTVVNYNDYVEEEDSTLFINDNQEYDLEGYDDEFDLSTPDNPYEKDPVIKPKMIKDVPEIVDVCKGFLDDWEMEVLINDKSRFRDVQFNRHPSFPIKVRGGTKYTDYPAVIFEVMSRIKKGYYVDPKGVIRDKRTDSIQHPVLFKPILMGGGPLHVSVPVGYVKVFYIDHDLDITFGRTMGGGTGKFYLIDKDYDDDDIDIYALSMVSAQGSMHVSPGNVLLVSGNVSFTVYDNMHFIEQEFNRKGVERKVSSLSDILLRISAIRSPRIEVTTYEMECIERGELSLLVRPSNNSLTNYVGKDVVLSDDITFLHKKILKGRKYPSFKSFISQYQGIKVDLVSKLYSGVTGEIIILSWDIITHTSKVYTDECVIEVSPSVFTGLECELISFYPVTKDCDKITFIQDDAYMLANVKRIVYMDYLSFVDLWKTRCKKYDVPKILDSDFVLVAYFEIDDSLSD